MKSKVLWALIALNVLLLVGLVAPLGRGTAQAQVGVPKVARAGDKFLMISGEITGGNSAVVYIIDETTNQLNARTYIESMPRKGVLGDLEPIDLDRVFSGPAGGGGGR